MCRLQVFLLAVLYSTALFSSVPDEKRVLNFLTVDDTRSACFEGVHLVEQYPHSKECLEVYIQALAKRGEVKKTLQVWNRYQTLFPDQKENRVLLENMAWGVIEKGSKSPSAIVRTYAMLGAFFGQDARGVKVVLEKLSDPNVAIRAFALKLSAVLRDAQLQTEALRLLREDSNVHIRIEAIRALGQMKMQAAEPYLLRILTDPNTRSEEKQVAIEALVTMYDTVKLSHLQSLSKSSRASLRQLACQVVMHTETKEALGCVIPLLKDSSSDVRRSAIETLGYLRVKRWKENNVLEQIKELTCDPHPHVAISAAWALTLHSPSEGQSAFAKWIDHPNLNYRLLAASALSSTGKYGTPYLQQAFEKSRDRFQKMNLAIGLIMQGTCLNEACQGLFEGLTKETGKWMWEQQGIFRVLSPSRIKFSGPASNQPEVVNQLTRLEILNILTINENPFALPAVKHFLNRTHWGITATASALLLQEGDENAITIVKELLDDSNSKVRIQAALILAHWGRGEQSIRELQESYPRASREIKERILEGLGRVGSNDSISFLISKLGEPQPTLRMIAASSLLQCLYH